MVKVILHAFLCYICSAITSSLCLKVQCPLEVVNLGASRDVAVLDFSYKFGSAAVCDLT